MTPKLKKCLIEDKFFQTEIINTKMKLVNYLVDRLVDFVHLNVKKYG